MKKNGFSIMELLLVLALTAVMVAMTIPAFHKVARGGAVSNGASEIANTLMLARQLAVTKRTHALVAFPTENSFLAFGKVSFGIYVLTNQMGASSVSNWVMADRWQHLNTGAYVYQGPSRQRSLLVSTNANAYRVFSVPCIEFNASGQIVDNSDITLTIQEGTQIDEQIININSANQIDVKSSFVTGKVKIIKP